MFEDTYSNSEIAYHMSEYHKAMNEYRQDWDKYCAELEQLLGGEIPEFISTDYIHAQMYEISPQELIQEIKDFFQKVK